MKRFLITTALEDSWRDDMPVLFLGEWCRLHARRSRWQVMDAQVLPYHWDDRERLHLDYSYLRDFYERLLADTARTLNQRHGVSHGIRYWRIVLGPWLGYFVQALYDRWACIKRAVGGYQLSGTVVIARKSPLVPNDMGHFLRLFVHDEWNHQIYAWILERYADIATTVRPCVGDDAATRSRPRRSLAWQVKETLAQTYTTATSAVRRRTDAFFISTYLPLTEDLRLQLRLKQVPQIYRSPAPPRFEIDPSAREFVVEGSAANEFEDCARRLVPQQIPAAYLEGYQRLQELSDSLGWPEHPRVIWTSNAFSSDDVFKVWAAERVERQCPLVIGQHGGHYGVGRWSFSEEHEIAVCDKYLSWGWTDGEPGRVAAVGQLKAKRPLGIAHDVNSRALLVTCALPRYSYWMYSVFVAGQYLSYFDDQCRFVDALPEAIRRRLTIRLFPEDWGWDQRARWHERCPGVEVDEGKMRMVDLVRETRIYISTYNATTYLESLSMDVPTVIYWNPKHWELRDSAMPYFEELRRVGIFHESPESAAKQVAAVWDDVHSWWNSSPVREAVLRFTNRFCKLPDDLLEKLERTLREVMATPDGKVS